MENILEPRHGVYWMPLAKMQMRLLVMEELLVDDWYTAYFIMFPLYSSGLYAGTRILLKCSPVSARVIMQLINVVFCSNIRSQCG